MQMSKGSVVSEMSKNLVWCTVNKKIPSCRCKFYSTGRPTSG